MLSKLVWLIKKGLREFDFNTYPNQHNDEGCSTKKGYYDFSNEDLKDKFIDNTF